MDRVGQVWETGSMEVWLVTSTEQESETKAKHNILILDSRVARIKGKTSWTHENAPRLWETTRGFTRLF